MNSENSISPYFSACINGVFHVLILFTFLSILFFALVSTIEKQNFEEQIQGQVDSSIKSAFKTLSSEEKDKISSIINNDLGGEETVFDVGIDNYSKPKEVTVEHNKWVKITAISIILMIFLSLFLVLTVLSFSCNKNIGLLGILKENIITFIFIGLVEYLFFTYVALKYIPVLPSTMMTTVIQTFQKIFK